MPLAEELKTPPTTTLKQKGRVKEEDDLPPAPVDIDSLVGLFEARRLKEQERLDAVLSDIALSEAVETEFRRIENAVQTDNETWKQVLPGRPILKAFAAKAKIEIATLKRLYIKCAQDHANNPFLDIKNIFDEFAKFDSHVDECVPPQKV